MNDAFIEIPLSIVGRAAEIPRRQPSKDVGLMREHTYGVLVADGDHPLSSVSVANSSLSIDLWTGCAWQCAYCHVQGSLADLNDELAMDRVTRRRTNHSIPEIVDALIEHPFFSTSTVLSIGTASTEPLAPGKVVDSTFDIIDEIQRRGLDNSFWIVTKRGMPASHLARLEAAVERSSGIMLSMCWAGNPAEVEPVQNWRFLNAEQAKASGASIAWYLRPLSAAWSGQPQRIEEMMVSVRNRLPAGTIDYIVPGGLRWSEAIERVMRDHHGVEFPNAAEAEDESKSELAGSALGQQIVELAARYFPSVPVYFRSGCALSAMLRRPSISGVARLAPRDCLCSVCPTAQRWLCAASGVHNLSAVDVQHVATKMGIPVEVIRFDGSSLDSTPPFESLPYAYRQSIINRLGDSS